MTSGITSSLDLIARQYVQPGDTVLVGDPAWFLMFGRFAAQGAQVIGVPYTAEGPTWWRWRGWCRCAGPSC